ncbi:type IV toxin-antitoxin system AbiEi family antitoxin domain-containing protein [bacterium]|nr:type IV toxin-antitoxin system AbiEi family antitoxin domain-containing protein [bacterium]
MNIREFGISAENIQRIRTLNQKMNGPFTVTKAAKIFKISNNKTSGILSYLANKGWLNRISRGLYCVVPLDATSPSAWQEDPWLVISKILTPGYIGGWSACEHWDFTEQIFHDIVYITSCKPRNNNPVIQDIRYRIKTILEKKLFGLKTIWKGTSKIKISDPTRTIVDILDEPSLGGGIRNTAEMLHSYINSEYFDEKLLLLYIQKVGNRSIYKRLGYLLEILNIEKNPILCECSTRMSKGYSSLDPAINAKGELKKKWNLWINSVIRPKEEYS